ncbi:TonB-linked outer membrane protein, SusC/RagA family [Robiginitalea myxolifaciens]|uniref:TonB-linked outer membrane protein, SusC/RagA family n=1 Tax=Robiginitalea myxolifaciens TaxID=400055 RepID=A0A1I6H9S9_9FLAO|nr:TonB-dependent receptor [Robiginitalea myxolifaciens]SFR51255.1 TonB-linked outer membrane protein, SusC/RagA family [Robiginitalea myxolifaciens]
MKYLKMTLCLALLLTFAPLQAQEQKTVSGTVTDQAGIPLPGVNILVEDSQRGTQSDFDGNYSIQAAAGEVLVFSYLGQETQRLTVGASNRIDVAMQEDATALEEVVVIGYGNQEQRKIIQNVGIVKEEAIDNLVVTSADQLLQGQTAGTQIVNSSGVLGSASVIRVRGVNSINSGSQPLIVIDGVPITDTETNTLNRGGNTGINPLSYVNPNDIESLTVLKDAGATSIYGSRGANGVILITTKKGRKNQAATVTLDVSTQYTSATDVPEILSADEFRTFKSEVASIQQGTTVTPEDLNLGALGSGGTDWLAGVQRTGISQNYSLGIRGGTENTTYFIGADFQDTEGFIIGNNQQRSGARINLETEVNSWLTAGMNLGVTNTRLNRVGVENNTFAPFTTAFLQSPVVPAFDDEGNFAQSGSFIPNIFAIVALDTDELKTFRSIGNFYAEITPFKNVTYRADFGFDKLELEEFLRFTDFNTPGGAAQQLNVAEDRWLTNQTLTYTNQWGDHSLTALAGLNYEETLRTRSNVSVTGFLTDDLRNLGSGSTPTILNGDRFPSRLYGLFGRASYDYAGKYLVEGSLRRDGSSRFGRNNRFGYFWSVAAGWVLSEENFLADATWLDYLSLRASLGTVGNDRLGTFPSLGLFNAGAIADYNGQSGVIPNQPANPDLKWEESETLDIGIRSTLFKGRLTANIAYFKKTTSDLLLNQVLPPQTGFTSISRNVGEMENRGWEFDISSVNVRTDKFEWRTSLNLTTIDNEVLRLNADAATDEQGRRIIDGPIQRAIEGESLNNFFLIRYVGVNPETGDAEWLDKDGNITLNPGSGDRVVAGSPLPDFSGGITNTFRYGNLDLSILMNYSYGNDVVIDGLRFADGNDAIGGIVNIRRQNLDYWQAPGDRAFLPSPTSSTFNLFNQRSTLQMLDASYLRLKNVTLGYNLPQRALDQMGGIFKGLRLYVTGTNLFTIKRDEMKGIDPEVTDDIDPLFQGESFFTAPQAKSYLFGARITF